MKPQQADHALAKIKAETLIESFGLAKGLSRSHCRDQIRRQCHDRPGAPEGFCPRHGLPKICWNQASCSSWRRASDNREACGAGKSKASSAQALRYTDERTIEVVRDVLRNQIGANLAALIGESGAGAKVLSGEDDDLFRAVKVSAHTAEGGGRPWTCRRGDERESAQCPAG